MNSLLRNLTVLILPWAAMAIVGGAASPARVLHVGGTIDRIMARSVDIWVGRDTLDMFPPGRWLLYASFVDYATRQPAEGAEWRVVDTAAEPPRVPAAGGVRTDDVADHGPDREI